MVSANDTVISICGEAVGYTIYVFRQATEDDGDVHMRSH